MTVASSPLRAWIAAALPDGNAIPRLDERLSGGLIAVASEQGVLPLLERRLRSDPAWQEVPDALRTALADGAREAVMRALIQSRELHRIATVFSQSGTRALLLKGNALGLWLYPQPYLRVTSDIDLLFASREDADAAARALAAIGYVLEFSPGSMTYEMKCKLMVGGVSQCELDLHSRLLNAPAYAEVFSFEELWTKSIALPGMEASTRGLVLEHALAHACLNRALDMQVGVPDKLKLLYDIHLLVGRMDDRVWSGFVAMLRGKRIGGICLRTIEDTKAAFASAVPDHALDALRRLADAEPLDRRRLGDWRYMQWQNLKALPTMGARLRWLRERLLPTTGQLRELHGDGNWFQLMARRLVRGLLRLRNRG